MHIHIISPSGSIYPEYIDRASSRLIAEGHIVTEGMHARKQYGRFAGTSEERIADLQAAINSSEIEIILCSRGGYGLVQIIDRIDFEPLKQYPKLLIGFSDITVLHNALGQIDVPSLHGIMAKHIGELPDGADPIERLLAVLRGEAMCPYATSHHELNRQGTCTGIVRGGNLSVLYGLRKTPFDLRENDTILFIEDIAERPYHIDRMMNSLRLSGMLAGLKGLIVGQFSDCQEDPLMKRTIQEIIADAVSGYDYPVCFDFPAGHVEYNLPFWLNREARLYVTGEGGSLMYT